MEYRTLGRTGLNVSRISLGMEHLRMDDPATSVPAIRLALDSGVNFFDLLLGPTDASRAVLAEAFAGRGSPVMFAAHLGCGNQDGKYRRTRDAGECEAIFNEMVDQLPNDHVDVLYAFHNVDEQDDYETILTGGFELARRLRAEGRARRLGFSGHTAPLALEAVRTGEIDVLMYSISFKTHSEPGRDELLDYCAANDIGVIGMKTFAGGALLGSDVTPARCVSYSLSRPGVAAAAVGAQTAEHLRGSLAYLNAPGADTDFAGILASLRGDEHADGACTYCQHCLPCPGRIDIPTVLGLGRAAQTVVTDPLRASYAALAATIADCTDCGVCEERCPFDVPIRRKLRDTDQGLR